MIHVIFTAIVLGIAIKWWHDRTKKKQVGKEEPVDRENQCCPEEPVEPKESSTAACNAEEIIQLLGAEVKEKGERATLVLYQGGYFWLNVSENGEWLDIMYDNFGSYRCEHANKLLTTCNTVNDDLMGWKVVTRLENKAEQEEEPLMASLSFRLPMMGSSVQMADRLKTLLQQAFVVARYFSEKMENAIKDNHELDEHAVNDGAFRHKVKRAAHYIELGHQKEFGEETPDSSYLSVSALLKLFDDSEFGCLQRMRMVCGDRLEVCDDLSSITAFDIRDYIRSQEAPSLVADLTLLVEFEFQNLLVHLRKEDYSTDKSLFYLLTVSRSGSEADKLTQRQSSESFRTLVEIRLDGAESEYWEAKFMIDDAVDKVEGGRESDLTDEQRMLLSLVGSTMRSDLYWAKKYYNNHCFYQSLFHFKRVLNHLVSSWGELDEKNRELYFEICYFIGFIYMELNNLDRAFYYLFHGRNLNTLQSVREFTNCICNMNDPGTISYIKSNIHTALEELKKVEEEEGEDPALMDFYRFLNRRLAYALIEMNEFDEAETLLNKMIVDGDDAEFAKQEMDFLKGKKQMKEDKKKADEKKNND